MDPRQDGEADLRCRLERAERLLGCFQKAIGHEMPNQLVAVRGLVQMLQTEEADRLSPTGAEYLRRVHGAAGRLHALIGGLAELGRNYRDPGPAEPVPFAEAAEEAAVEISKLYPGVLVEYHFPHPVPALCASRAGLRQVLAHLLRNAAQAAVPGRLPRIAVGVRAAPGGTEFWVADSGRGLSPERQRRLFEPFPGSDAATAGSGLGLFLVRQIVEGWGGHVAVESEPGRDTVFTVWLPSAMIP